jgi:hypothetical protein
MTVSLEKIFFAYILKNKGYFESVKETFFKNPDIEFVYNVIRKYMLDPKNLGCDTPKNKQLGEMIMLENQDNRISREIIKMLLIQDLDEYDEAKFIKPKLHAWIMSNNIQDGIMDSVDESRKLDGANDIDSVLEIAGKIKQTIDEATIANFDDDDDYGTDFDDYEEHSQDHSVTKVKSGWSALDTTLGGGWDVRTLNILMAETNGGKCHISDTFIKHKHTNEILKINIKDFFEKIRSSK